jgi:hypothetical protein
LKLNFIVADARHYLAIVSSEGHLIRQVMYSNSNSIVSEERLLFESLWKGSIGLQKRIREFEETPRPEQKFEIHNGNSDYMSNRVNIVTSAKRSLDVCYEHDFAQQMLSPALWEAYQFAIRRGVKIRHITEVKQDNVRILLDLIKMGVEVRHINDVKGGFAVNETNMICTAAPATSFGNDTLSIDYKFPLLIKQAQWLFDTLWKSSTPADIMINRFYAERSSVS